MYISEHFQLEAFVYQHLMSNLSVILVFVFCVRRACHFCKRRNDRDIFK